MSLLVPTATLSSCAPEPPTIDPNSPVYAAAVQDLSKCFLQQATLVDDHKSDAETIAQAIQGSCTSQWSRVVALQLQGRNPEVQSLMLQNLQTNGEENGIAINAVLAERNRTN